MPVIPLVTWIRSFLSESNGQGSGSRLTVIVSTLAAVVLAYLVTFKGIDVPPGAQVLLLAAMGSGAVAYGANKVVSRATGTQAKDVAAAKPKVPQAPAETLTEADESDRV